MNVREYEKALQRTWDYLKEAGIVITCEEKRAIEVVDFSLGRLEELGLQLLTYINEDQYCAKELVLFPHQICPEHRHPEQNHRAGKKETFRCRWGEVYLYVPGKKTADPKGKVPQDKKETFTVWREILLTPGEQFTIDSNTLHWFQGGPKGAVVSEFSSHSHDESDVFTDEEIVRVSDPSSIKKIQQERGWE